MIFKRHLGASNHTLTKAQLLKDDLLRHLLETPLSEPLLRTLLRSSEMLVFLRSGAKKNPQTKKKHEKHQRIF